jgi:hypothetical protein
MKSVRRASRELGTPPPSIPHDVVHKRLKLRVYNLHLVQKLQKKIICQGATPLLSTFSLGQTTMGRSVRCVSVTRQRPTPRLPHLGTLNILTFLNMHVVPLTERVVRIPHCSGGRTVFLSRNNSYRCCLGKMAAPLGLTARQTPNLSASAKTAGRWAGRQLGPRI